MRPPGAIINRTLGQSRRGQLALRVLSLGLPTGLGMVLGPMGHAREAGANGLEEVVVTATKRAENVQRIAMAVSVLSSDTLDELRMRTVDDVARQVPNMTISRAGNSTPFVFIRGLGLSDPNAIAVGSVGIYQDEVYMNSTAAQLSQLFDLERVEVLRGPQGTLYGRNTTGGVVNLVSRRPEHRNSFEAMVGYGNDSQFDLEGAANFVVNDSTAGRMSFVVRERDSIFDNTNGTGDPSDVSNWAARGVFSFEPTSAQQWLLRLYGSSVDEAARGRDRSSVAANPGRMDPGTVRSEALTRAGSDQVDIVGATLIGTFDFPLVALASVTGFLNSKRDSRDDLDSQAPDILDDKRKNEADQFSQELRLSSAGGSDLDWTVGVYYFLEDLDGSVVLDANDLFGASFHSVTEFAQETLSAAVFADVTYDLAERWQLTGGARWTYEEKDYQVQREGFFNAPFVADSAVDNWAEPSGGVGVRYLFSDDAMAYLKFTRGFRAGGYNAGSSLPNPQFDPEFVGSWEVGLKSTWLRDALRVNVSAFSNQYEDMQVFTLVTLQEGDPPVQYLTNAAESYIKGLEVELAWRPTTNLQIDLAGGYLDAEFTEYIDDTNTDRSGNKLIASPELTFSGMFHYTVPLATGAFLRMTADVSYRDDYYFDAVNTGRTASHAYWLTGARVSYTSASERLGVSIWGRNLGDEVFVDRVATFVGIDSILIGNPRTYGVDFTFRL